MIQVLSLVGTLKLSFGVLLLATETFTTFIEFR
jgi:hypothetical protein